MCSNQQQEQFHNDVKTYADMDKLNAHMNGGSLGYTKS